MRRTYGSKKDTANVIERRDLFQNLNEKTTAYDAFSIQNIKQTKRELSCVGSSNTLGVASSKVRKKKFVKRIVKQVETSSRENTSASCYLTPDRSIRVNKPLDPFDLLLMTSPGLPLEARDRKVETVTSKVNAFERIISKKEGRTFTRRKPKKTKKINYSSTDSTDSDKENLADSINLTVNTSDIRSHKLQVEKIVNNSPKMVDDSINNIVNNLSLLNKLKQKYSMNDSANISLKVNRHRLTKNLLSPLLQKSPLCSTPFKVKYRGESIFKFSPIVASNICAPKHASLMEDNDDSNCSVVLLNKPKANSPNIEEDTLNSRPKYIIDEVTNNEILHPENKTDCKVEKSLEGKETSNIIADHTNATSIVEISSLQTTELEPFVGFSKEVINDIDAKFNEHVISIPHIDDNIKIADVTYTKFGENDSYIEERSDNSNNCSTGEIEIAGNDCFVNVLSHKAAIGDNTDNDDDNSLLQRTYEDENSLYDTCPSEQSSIQTSEEKQEPVVLLQRMNDSSFFKYYDKMKHEQEDSDDDSNSMNYETGSFEDCNNSNKSSNRTDFCSDIEENVLENKTDSSDEIDTNDKDDDNSEKEKFVSFVTTRRRNKVTNNSMISIFNDSNNYSSTDCDKTVLSNKGTELDNNSDKHVINAEANIERNVDVEKIIDLNKNSDDFGDTAVEQEARLSFVTLRDSNIADGKSSIRAKKSSVNPRSSRLSVRQSSLHSESVIQDSDMSRFSYLDTKPGIVLKPGKRWERCLSIYRRMTMMTDHFDKSILEEESTSAKGRKYRQSVISTMEMQEFNNSLHNESINSRRSTFVSKPSRSTIRIVKDPNSTRLSICNSTLLEDLTGFLNEECDDTIIELSKLSIADQTHEVTVLDNFHDTSNRIATAKDYVLRRCNQTDLIPFDECYPDSQLKNCHKIGEGVYGEVYLWRARDGRARVLKIIPIAGTLKVNGESQKDFHEIISEIVIAMELSALRAPIAEIERHFDEGKDVEALNLHAIENATDVFNEVLAVRCVYGSYPTRLLDLWDLYDECKGSENDNPAILPVDQQYIVLELANAGQDLESYQFNNAEQAHALFLQVAYGLAVAEEAYQFEHRDLHWGNVLIAPTEQKWATFVIRGRVCRVLRKGVRGAVIDYSLSRVALRLAPGDAAALYNDLARDDELFDAVGDYQFTVYRLMRDKLGNDWKNFEPYTNILWLHYTVDKMITALRYKRTNTKIHKHYIDKLRGIKSRILDYGSAAQFVLTDNEL